MANLSDDQRRNVRKFLEIFKKYTETEEFKKDMVEREKRIKFFKSLTPEKLEELSELEFGEMISILWASQVWTNKDYLVNNIISSNGIDKIRKSLYELFYGDKSPEERYERFLKEIKGLGPSSVTEMLASFYPDRCGIWNDRARKALKILGFEKILPLHKYEINAKEYKKFNTILLEIGEELRKAGYKNADPFFVDYYLYEVQKQRKYPEETTPEEEFDHNEIRDMVRDIGVWLGFDAWTEKEITRHEKVDVVWKTKIGNLGVVTYVFEVQKRGSIDSLILKLQKATKNKTVQKVVAVSDDNQLQKIKEKIADLPENFREMVSYLRVSDVKKLHEYLQEINKILGGIELVKEEVPF